MGSDSVRDGAQSQALWIWRHWNCVIGWLAPDDVKSKDGSSVTRDGCHGPLISVFVSPHQHRNVHREHPFEATRVNILGGAPRSLDPFNIYFCRYPLLFRSR